MDIQDSQHASLGVSQASLKMQNGWQDMGLIDHRRPEVETRLILGAGNRSAFGVLVERTSRFTFLCHLPGKEATSVREAFMRKLDDIPAARHLSGIAQRTPRKIIRWKSPAQCFREFLISNLSSN